MFWLFLFQYCSCGLLIVAIYSFAVFLSAVDYWKFKVNRDILVWRSPECDRFYSCCHIWKRLKHLCSSRLPAAECWFQLLLCLDQYVLLGCWQNALVKSAKCWQWFCWIPQCQGCTKIYPVGCRYRIQMDMYHNIKYKNLNFLDQWFTNCYIYIWSLIPHHLKHAAYTSFKNHNNTQTQYTDSFVWCHTHWTGNWATEKLKGCNHCVICDK